jgi:hypothetical protein
LTPPSLVFSSVSVGTSSVAQTVTLGNSGNATLSVSGIQATGDYAQTNNCPASLLAGNSCVINVTFTPTATGTRSGAVTISDSVAGSPQSVGLSGAGSDFSLASSTGQKTIKAGATASYALTVSSVGGSFSKAVGFNCGGLPANATCSFSPVSVTPGANGASTTVTITTTASSAAATPALLSPNRPVLAVWIQFQGLGLFGIVVAGCKKRSKRVTIFILLALLMLGMMVMSGCAGGTGIAQTGSTTYTVTVTGTSGALHHALPLTLTVQ